LENFLHVILRGSVKYEVLTRGKVLDFHAQPGTTFILPQGTLDELRWKGPTRRIAVAIHPSLLVHALEETAHERSIELTENWNLTDSNITAVLLAMTEDLNSGSPAGRLYGESLANALAVYLLTRNPYDATRRPPIEADCQDIGSAACSIILVTIWQTISACRSLRQWRV